MTNPEQQLKKYLRNASRRSFTLVETVIALAIMAFLIIEVSAVQGNSIVFSDYSRNATQATWLAKRLLSQVEYYWQTKPFPELEQDVREAKFEDVPEYTYDLVIKEWKFPFAQLLTGGAGGGEEGGEGEDGGMEGLMETVVKQVFGDEPQFMTARADVCWAEGAQRACVGITNLLTNQAKVDLAVAQFKSKYDQINKPKKKDDKKKTPPKPTPAPGKKPEDQDN